MRLSFCALIFLLSVILIPFMLDSYLTEDREDYLIEIRNTLLDISY